MLPALIPLLGLLAPLVPSIGRLVGGSGGERAVAQITDAVQAVAGGTTPELVKAALADPDKAGDLLLRLQQIEAEAEKVRADAAQAELVARLGDLAGARAHTVALAEQKSPLAYGAVLMTIFVMLICAGFTYLLMTQAYPEGSRDIVLVLAGQVLGWGGAAVAYWLGSSAGSAEKNRLLAAAGPLVPPGSSPR